MATKVNYCSQCGASVSPEAKFCPSCGLDVSDPGSGPTLASPKTLEEEVEDQLRQSLVGEYDIKGLLGIGGMAIVYKGYEIMLDREVAIKVLPPQMAFGGGMIERFTREAKTAAKLNHPNIIPIYRIGELGRTVYFVMKYVVGRGLDEILEEQGRLSMQVISSILQQIGGALTYAHKRGVIHRDIKPSNIMLDDEGWALVMDFGIAKAAGTSSLTATGAAIGTPHYMSPEQCHGTNITPLSDQYALGIMTYQMIAGRVPFEGETVPELMTQHFFEEPSPLSELCEDCPRTVTEAVHRSLSKKPEERFASLADFVTACTTTEEEATDRVRTQISQLATGSMPLIRTPPPASPVPRGRLPIPPPSEPAASPATKPEHVADEMADAATTPIPADGLGKPVPAETRDRKTKRLIVTRIAAASVLFAVAAGAFLVLGGQERLLEWIRGIGSSAVTSSTDTQPVGSGDLTGDGAPATATDLGSQQGQPTEGGQGPGAEPVASAGLDTGRTQAPTERDQQQPAARPAPPPSGRLRIAGVPPGARASVDGSRVMNLQNLTLRTGQHSIAVEADGYRTLEGTVTVTSGRLSTFDASGMQRIPAQQPAALPAPPPSGRLWIAGAPIGARASVDGSRITNLQNLPLRTGQHTISVEADGYRTLEGTITIRNGRLSTFDAGGMQRIPVPPTDQIVSHPLCATSATDAAAIAGTASAAMVLKNCVPDITVRLRGRPLNTAELPTNQRLRIVIAASGYQTLRVDTTLSPGTVLVLSGALVSRN